MNKVRKCLEHVKEMQISHAKDRLYGRNKPDTIAGNSYWWLLCSMHDWTCRTEKSTNSHPSHESGTAAKFIRHIKICLKCIFPLFNLMIGNPPKMPLI